MQINKLNSSIFKLLLITLVLVLFCGTDTSMAIPDVTNCRRAVFHFHTTNSDGTETLDGMIVKYRDYSTTAPREIACVADHDYISDANQYTTGTFLGINGFEASGGPHVVGLGVSSLGSFSGGSTLQSAIDNIIADGGLPMVAHPYWSYDYAGYDMPTFLAGMTNCNLIAVYNHYCQAIWSNGNSESYWDTLLSADKVVYGYAEDDAHGPGNKCGFAVNMVDANSFTVDAVKSALINGQSYFYTTYDRWVSGMTISSYSVSGTTSGDTISIATTGGVGDHTIKFIGNGGSVLKTVSGSSGSYTITGTEKYVRIKITDSAVPVAPANLPNTIWTQPVFVTAGDPPSPPPSPAVMTVTFVAGDANGWPFYDDLEGDIFWDNIVDWNDLEILTGQWLDTGDADIDYSGTVDFNDYALLAGNWKKLAGENVLLQTIYGTTQDSNGDITVNNYRAVSIDKGLAIAFAVDEDTTLDKAIFKCVGVKVANDLRIRLYDVTGSGYLTYGHTMSRANPGGVSNDPILETTSTSPNPVPSHAELGDGRAYTDMIIDFGPLEVSAGQYLMTFDAMGENNTWGSMIRGLAAEAEGMGQYPDGNDLPHRAIVTTSSESGNAYFYQLDSITDTDYSPYSYLYAFQMLKTTVNHAPDVDAGENQIIIDPVNYADMNGTVTDDGQPNPPGAVTTLWSKQSGPGSVVFDDANQVDTTATFDTYGEYVLRLTADDSNLSAYDEVTITYFESLPENDAPDVNAGADQQITLPSDAILNGTVTDDGLPDPPATVTTLWTKESGTGTVTFADPCAVDTTASFSEAGTYVLRLTANDSLLQSYDELTVTVNPFGSYQGYGAGATGGAGGSVVWVTSLANSGTGTLREAVDALDGSPTIIKFSVGGSIMLTSAIDLDRGNVTIMGSSAPNPGITLDADLTASYRCLEIDASNIIIENMRFRNAAGENVLIWGGRDMVFDHCSFTWSADGALDINGGDWGSGANHITISRCLFGGAEELSRSHGHQISWHYNLFTTNNRRQPKLALAGPDYNMICNYIRNWCNTATHVEGGQGGVNIINNYYGPPYPTETWPVACYADGAVDANNIYTTGNEHAPDNPSHPPRGTYNVNNVGLASTVQISEGPPPVAVTVIPAADVPANVLADVGAQPTDSHDEAYISGSYTGRDRTIGGYGP